MCVWTVPFVSSHLGVLAPTVNGEQENRVQKGNGYFQVPPHTPVIFGEAGGRTLFRYSRNTSVNASLRQSAPLTATLFLLQAAM